MRGAGLKNTTGIADERKLFGSNNVTTEEYPEGVYVNWRSGFFIAVNFSSENQPVNVPENAKIIIGEKILKPTGVLV